ncbi:peptidase domain-containing ABC transporter [Eubacterium ramulus]
MKKRLPLIKQHDQKDCAAASLAMILAYYGKRLPLATVREALQVDMYGASIYGLQKGAETFGLVATAYEGNSEDVWEAMKDSSNLPAVLRIINEHGFEHFIVVKRLVKDKLYVCDPDKGCKNYSFKSFNEQFLGQIILFQKSDVFVSENLKKGSIKRFTGLIFEQKNLLVAIAVLSLIVTAIGMTGAFVFQYLIDNVLHDVSDNALDSFAVILTGLVILYICRFISEIIRGKLLCILSKRMSTSLILGYSDHLTELPIRFFKTYKTGEILSRYEDASKVTDALSSVTLTVFIDMIMTLGCGLVLYKESPTMFTVVIGIFFTYLLVNSIFIKPLEKFNRTMMEKNSQLTSYLKETICASETIKSCQGEKSVKNKTHQFFDEFVSSNIRVSMLQVSKESITDMITSIGTLLVLWCGALKVIQGEISIGELLSFYTLMSYFLSPVESILSLQSKIQSALVAANRLNDVYDLKQEETGSMNLDKNISEIIFDKVKFRYGHRETVLDNISFSVKKGEKLALVGESGSGKSTISKLLESLYHSESGEIKINGQQLEMYTLSSLRKRIASVSQNIFLFSDSIKNNLIFGISEDEVPSDEEIERVLTICKCDFVKEQPFGMYSMLEENASNLSGGQKQRLAIARALLRKPQVLILDEATSALDSETEFEIQKNLKAYLPDIITISITHKMSTTRDADQILVLNHGEIIERGSHEELISKPTVYAEMWNRQNAA